MNKNISQINTLKVISAIAVFLIHYFGIYMSAFGIADANLSFVRMVCNFSVPTFFMISGFLYSGKECSYSKILYKVLYYYLITIFLNIIYSIFFQIFKLHNHNIDFVNIAIDSIKLNLTSNSHLWFMRCIMVIYLFVPIFSSLTDNKLFIFTIIGIILSVLKPLYFSSFNFPFPLQYFFAYYLIGASYKRMEYGGGNSYIDFDYHIIYY